MMPTKGTRAFIYPRVSDVGQVDGHSLDAQERESRRWCEKNGYTDIRIWREEGRTAHVDQIEKRPVLTAMLAAVDRQEGDIVVVHTLDRWRASSMCRRSSSTCWGRQGSVSSA